jgi:plasmid stability protein
MAQIIVRNLDEDVKRGLRERANLRGKSMEEEVRDILRATVLPSKTPAANLGSRVAARFAGIGLDAPIEELRHEVAQPADLDP